MINNSLHLLFKFTENAPNNILTMEEHLKVQEANGSVIWGHFSTSQTKKGLWDEKVEIMESQIKNGEEAFVLFTDKSSSLLYIGRYIQSWKASEFDRNHPKLHLVPSYYHNAVGLPANGQLRSYCYVEVDHIRELDFNYINNIYSSANGNAINSFSSQNSVFYVNLEESLYSKLKNDYIIWNTNLESDTKERLIIDSQIIELTKNGVSNSSDSPKAIPEKQLNNARITHKRNPSILARALISASFLCEIEEAHKTFTSSSTGKPYVEGHHFIPMSRQSDFDVSLDVEGNIVALCPNCHRLIHHGSFDEKEIVLETIYQNRKQRLLNCGINIPFNKLKKLYE